MSVNMLVNLKTVTEGLEHVQEGENIIVEVTHAAPCDQQVYLRSREHSLGFRALESLFLTQCSYCR